MEGEVDPAVAKAVEDAVAKRDTAAVRAAVETASDVQLAKDFALYVATQHGNEELINEMLAGGANPNRMQRRGRRGVSTCLHSLFVGSFCTPKLSIAELLIQHGADPNSRDENGNSPVGAATLRGYDAFTTLFLNNGADISQTNSQGNNLLHLAVSRPGSHDPTPLINELLKRGVDLATQNNQGDTPLMKAVRQGALLAVKAIAQHVQQHPEARKSVLMTNRSGSTVLHEAAVWGNADLVSFLLQTGWFDPNCKDADGNTPLHLAGDRKKVGALVKAEDPQQVASALLSSGASVSCQNKKGSTIFHLADCSIEFLNIGLQHADSTNTVWSLKDANGDAPIIAQLRSKRPYHVQALVAHVDAALRPTMQELIALFGGLSVLDPLVEIDAADTLRHLFRDESPTLETRQHMLRLALSNFALDCLCLISRDWRTPLTSEDIQFCASHTDEGQTVLHKAVRKNHAEAVSILLQSGFDVNAVNEELDEFSDGGQPIHDAAVAGSLECINVLLEAGADINSQENPRQETPLQIACRFNRIPVVLDLLKRGADPLLCDIDGTDAISEAEMRPDTDMEILDALSAAKMK